MSNLCPFEKLLIDYIEKDLPPGQITQLCEHLQQCNRCATQFKELQSLYHLLSARKRPDPPAMLMKEYRANLNALFKSESWSGLVLKELKSVWSAIVTARFMRFRLAKGFAILILGIFIGRIMFNPANSEKIPVPQENPVILPVTPADLRLANDFLNDSEILLLQIVNAELDQPFEASDLLISQEMTKKMLIKSLIVKEMSLKIKNATMANFLTHLDLLLYELDNASAQEWTNTLQQIRHFIIETDLLNESRKLKQSLEILFIQDI